MPSTKSLRRWHGVIFLYAGAYKGGIFKFTIDLKSYPKSAPKVAFTSRVFNPLINLNTGELDMSIQFPVWDSSIHSVAVVLAYIKSVFYNAAFWTKRRAHPAFNQEAARLYEQDRERFDKLCEKCVKASCELPNKFDNTAAPLAPLDDKKAAPANAQTQAMPASSIRFSPDETNHSRVNRRIMQSHQERQAPDFSFASWFSDGVSNLVSYVGVPTGSAQRVPAPAPFLAKSPEMESKRVASPELELDDEAGGQGVTADDFDELAQL